MQQYFLYVFDCLRLLNMNFQLQILMMAVQVHVQGTGVGAPWVQVPYLSASSNTAGVREITHELQHFNAGEGARVRLTLTGSTTARPTVRTLRGVVL